MTSFAVATLAEDWPTVEVAIDSGRWADLRREPAESESLVRVLHMYPIVNGDTYWHCFVLHLGSYPAKPPSVKCVHPLTKEEPRKGYAPWWPASAAPNVNLQLTNDPPYFCFPYTLEYALTHGPQPESDPTRWNSSTHNVHAVVTELRRVFLAPHYRGYQDPDFLEVLRVEVADKPSPYAPSDPRWSSAKA